MGQLSDTDKNRSVTTPSGARTPVQKPPHARPDDKEHEGATENEVLPTTPPRSPEYDDEPREG
jgi:hypothetical protein